MPVLSVSRQDGGRSLHSGAPKSSGEIFAGPILPLRSARFPRSPHASHPRRPTPPTLLSEALWRPEAGGFAVLTSAT